MTTKNSNGMKKLFFSFVMLVTLVIVAGSAKAQTAVNPYIGLTYHYTLGGIKVLNTSTAVVTYTDAANVTLPGNITVSTSDNSIAFDVTYKAGVQAGNLTVTITDNLTTCSNYINLAITPTAAPTLDLAVSTTSNTAICQNLNTGTIADNTAANVGASPNTFTIKVTATTTGTIANDATYSFKFDLNDYKLGSTTDISIEHTSGDGTVSVDGTTKQITVTGASAKTIQDQVFTVTFATTTGIATETITGTASDAVLQSGGTVPTNYTGTISTPSISVDVKSMPAIGTFTY